VGFVITLPTLLLTEQAIANLHNYFIFVSIQERFNESAILLQRIIGIKRLPLYKNVNVTKDRLPISAIPNHLIEEIEKRNQFDFQVYAYAQERFHKDLSQMGITDQELKRFMMLNNWYGMLTGRQNISTNSNYWEASVYSAKTFEAFVTIQRVMDVSLFYFY